MKSEIGSLPVVLLVFLAFTSSCRYQPGANDWDTPKTLFVQVVSNDSALPQAGGVVSRTIREEFLRRGTFRLVRSENDAEFLLRVKIGEFTKSPEVFRSQDTLLAAGFALHVGAYVTLYSSGSKTSIFEDRLVQADASSLKPKLTSQARDRQSTAAIARELGLKIANQVSNHSW